MKSPYDRSAQILDTLSGNCPFAYMSISAIILLLTLRKNSSRLISDLPERVFLDEVQRGLAIFPLNPYSITRIG